MGLAKPPLIVDTCASCGRTEDDHNVRHRFVSQQTEDVKPEPLPPSEPEVEEEPPSDPEEASADNDADDGRPSQASGRGEMIRRYQEQHLCVGCAHVEVCEVGRHTAELFGGGWFVVISDCNSHETAD